MKTTPMILAAVLVASAMVAPVAADPPGNWSLTFEFMIFSYFDFKEGAGIYDSGDPDHDSIPPSTVCILKLLGLRIPQPISITYEGDQNMGTNLNGPAIGISDLGLGKPGGIDTDVPCPTQIGGTGFDIFITFHGMNWRAYEHDSSANLFLCTQKVFASSSPGCLAIPNNKMLLWASACDVRRVFFGADYTDGKGKHFAGQPYDTLLMKSDMIKCDSDGDPTNGIDNNWDRTINYTDTIQDFTAGGAGQTFDLIKNEAVVPAGGKATETNPYKGGKPKGDTNVNTAYMAVCWQMSYLNFSDPLNPTPGLAQTHDWKLIKDLQGFLKDLYNLDKLASDPESYLDNLNQHILKWQLALDRHYGGAITGDNDIPLGSNTGLRGFYSQDAGNPKAPGAGQNGFPCDGPAIHHSAKDKKPTPTL